MELFEKVKATIIEHRLLSPGDTVIVAVSGGADSTALLHLLAELRQEWRLSLVVAHLDHRIRVDSAGDAQFVIHMAKKLGFEVVADAVDVRTLARARKQSLEEAGREARYGFLGSLARAHDAQRIATAHTQDDDVETVFMRLLRDDPWEALTAIPIARPLENASIIRPLLRVRREELLRYLSARSIQWREDPTNRDLRFDRNWIRARALPSFEEVLPDGRALLLNLSETAHGVDRLLTELTSQWTRNMAEVATNLVRIPLDEFRSQPLALQRRVLRWAVAQIASAPITLPAELERRGLQVAMKGRPGDAAEMGSSEIRVHYDAVEIAMGQLPRPRTEYRLRVPGTVTAEEFGVTLTATPIEVSGPSPSHARASDEVYLDAAALGGELRIRPWRPGDRMQPLGMRGKKKVQDIFVDDKVPRWERHRIPVVTDARGRIVWIVGRRVAEAARVSERTRQAVRLRAAPAGPISSVRNTPDNVRVARVDKGAVSAYRKANS